LKIRSAWWTDGRVADDLYNAIVPWNLTFRTTALEGWTKRLVIGYLAISNIV